MNQDTLAGSLKQIEVLVGRCLQELGESKQKKVPKSFVAPSATASTLPDHIVQLREEGFFKEPRVAREVHEELKGRYSCELNRVVMALRRLMERKMLRRASKRVGDRIQKAYVW